MKKLNFKEKWVLVTGASSGLGKEMAKQLAYEHGANLIVSARRTERLIELKEELESQANVRVKIAVADLSQPAEVEGLLKIAIQEQELYAAILNAGTTYFGEQMHLEGEMFETILQTNVRSMVVLSNGLVNYFEQSGKSGGLMFVASLAAYFPVPYQALYSGTKAFVMAYVNALSCELRNKNFSLTVYAPGGIVTEMTESEKFNELRKWLMPVRQAAKEGIYAFQTRKLNWIPGRLNRWGSRVLTLFPRRFITNQLAKQYRNSLHPKT